MLVPGANVVGGVGDAPVGGLFATRLKNRWREEAHARQPPTRCKARCPAPAGKQIDLPPASRQCNDPSPGFQRSGRKQRISHHGPSAGLAPCGSKRAIARPPIYSHHLRVRRDRGHAGRACAASGRVRVDQYKLVPVTRVEICIARDDDRSEPWSWTQNNLDGRDCGPERPDGWLILPNPRGRHSGGPSNRRYRGCEFAGTALPATIIDPSDGNQVEASRLVSGGPAEPLQIASSCRSSR